MAEINFIQLVKGAKDEVVITEYVPVRHGRWIRKDHDIECSECHARIDERDLRWAIDTEAKYCLNCGCKMDEVGE